MSFYKKRNWRSYGAHILAARVLMAIILAVTASHSVAMEVMNFSVKQEGIYRVTHAELLDAGIDLTGLQKRQIGIYNAGERVARRINKQVWDSGAFVEFIGEPIDSLYTENNIYILTVDERVKGTKWNGAKVSSGASVPFYMETIRVEDEKRYSHASPNGDPWYDKHLFAISGPIAETLTIPVDNYVAGAATASISVNVSGATSLPQNPDHHIVLDVNGNTVADETFDGQTANLISADLPGGALVEGSNSLTVTLPHDTGAQFDLQYLDSYSVTYPREFKAKNDLLIFEAVGDVFAVQGFSSRSIDVYKIDDTGKVTRLKRKTTNLGGGNYQVKFNGSAEAAKYYVASAAGKESPEMEPPADGGDITTGVAQYLVITHSDFLGTDLDLLVQARQAQGYTVKVVSVEDVYAQFSHHLVDAQAIKDYVTYAQANMDAEMVVLIGGDSYDYKDHLGLESISFIPSLYAQTDAIVRFAPVDSAYGDIDGDNIPDIPVGRIPARESAEFATLVSKMTSYDARTYGDTAVFAADEFDAAQVYSFKDDSEAMIASLPSNWQSSVTRAYIDDLGVAGAQSALVESINAGVALTSFAGHSDTTRWTFKGLFSAANALHPSEDGLLDNAGSPTVVTQWGCWNTYYASPTQDTLAHQFMLSGDQGAVAVLGASTLTQAASERRLALELYQRLFEQDVPMGKAIIEAKKTFALNNPNSLDVLLGWNLLGDPALVVQQ